MPHLRQTIRETAATAVTGLTTTGANVYQSRVYPHEAQALPSLAVYTLAEQVDLESMCLGSHAGWRTLDLVVEGRARAAANMDDTLDTIASEVEVALTASIDNATTGLGQYAAWGELVSTDITLDEEAEAPTGLVTLTWQLRYQTSSADPTTVIP